jgi:molybdopterin synthase sulfur carrier subunit
MTVTVRFFASLRESLGRAEARFDVAGAVTVAEVWTQVSAGRPLPDHILAAVNMEYAQPDQTVADGDEVAFFPPVTGGGR